MKLIILEGSIDYPWPAQTTTVPTAYKDVYTAKRKNFKLLDDLRFDVEEVDTEYPGWFVDIDTLEGLAYFLQETDAMVVWYEGMLGLLFGLDKF